MCPCVFDVAFEKFNFVTLDLEFQMLVTHFAFQIDNQMVGVLFTSTTEFEVTVLSILLEL